MTGNQIAYWKLQEDKRANLVNEDIKRDTLTETQRANLVNEGIKSDTLQETKRANLVQEGLKQDELDHRVKMDKNKNAQNWISTFLNPIAKVAGAVL